MAATVWNRDPRNTKLGGAFRPELRLVHGGRSFQVIAAQQRRRRVVAVLAATVAVIVLVFGWWSLEAVTARWAPGATPAHAPSNPSGPVVVVQPGDTLWAIAARLRPGHDPRPVVDQLVEIHGSAPLQPGDRIPVSTIVRR